MRRCLYKVGFKNKIKLYCCKHNVGKKKKKFFFFFNTCCILTIYICEWKNTNKVTLYVDDCNNSWTSEQCWTRKVKKKWRADINNITEEEKHKEEI